MNGRLAVLGGFLTTLILPILPIRFAFADTSNPTATVIISEIKLGGDSYSQGADQPKDPQEFITLYNQSDSKVDLSNWVLEYAKPIFDKTFCSSADWMPHSVSSSVSQTVLSGTLQPGQVSTPIIRSLTDNSAGSLQLVNASDQNNLIVEDLVGWGTTAPCYENTAATTPSNGKSLKRYLDCDNLPIDSGNNMADFAANQPPSPGVLGNPNQTMCQDNSSNGTEQAQPTCEGVLISELLPNPAGTDTGNEYIELYNPTSATISLQGCSLQTTASSKVYNFSNVALQPGEYHAFYDDETDLTLPNSIGGTAWLLSPSTELQAIIYQANLDDDVAWALVAGGWQATYQPTPNATNVLVASKPCPEGEERSADTGYCHSTATLTTSTLTVCKVGQVRNPETNRCRSVSSSSDSSLIPCKPDQERNPETNRCRSVSSESSSLTPCKAGQERNPATNRCKSIVTTASASLKPCSPGQERNPATNRCRKVTSASTGKLATVKDAVTGSITTNPHWWLAGFAAVGATSYGIYEWRQEVLQFLSRLKSKLPSISGK